MENRGIVKIICFLFSFLMTVAIAPSLFAYSDKTTHPALTDEIVDFFNINHPDLVLNSEEKEAVIRGSVQEDAFGRWMRHFYDPVYERGLEYGMSWQSSKDWAGDTLAQSTYKIQDTIDRPLYGKVIDFFSADTDYSWDRAIYEYAWKDKIRGLEALGHILHLIEDATVPDHTRNDPHPAIGKQVITRYPNVSSKIVSLFEHFDHTNESPYETWTAQFDRSNIGLVEKLTSQNLKPLYLENLDEYFNVTAKFSNNNFFSRDTVLSNEYTQPFISFEKSEIIDNLHYTFGYRDEGNNSRLVRIELQVNEEGEILKTYTLKDRKDFILSDYWSLLSQEAVLNGAGIVKLFFDEVAREKENKILYNKNKSWFAKMYDSTAAKIYNITASLYGISVDYGELDFSAPQNSRSNDNANQNQSQQDNNAKKDVTDERSEDSAVEDASRNAINKRNDEDADNAAKTERDLNDAINNAQTNQNVPSFISSLSPVPLSAMGGGGGVRLQTDAQKETQNGTQIKTQETQETQQTDTQENNEDTEDNNEESQDTTPPSPPQITLPSDFSRIFTDAHISFSGNAEPQALIFSDIASTTVAADLLGLWTLVLDLLQGTSTLQFFAKDAAGNISQPETVALFIDSIAPQASFYINECEMNSISPDGCLLLKPQFTLNWSSGESDIKEYKIECIKDEVPCDDFPKIFDALATSTNVASLDTDGEYEFTLHTYDIAGNHFESTRRAEVRGMPVVINEIAWMGTGSSHALASDEWVELYNSTSQTISFDAGGEDSKFVLYSETSNSPYIKLIGTVEPNSYYLIERTDDAAISDIAADLISSFGDLNDSGEKLSLGFVTKNATTTIDQVVYCFNWCKGNKNARKTMERFDVFKSGLDANNWGTHNGYFFNGKNADGTRINGTPRARNSISYQIANASFITEDITLATSHGPYFVPGTDFVIKESAVLTLEPGVVIKFADNSRLVAEGTIRAEGASEDPIVFTAFSDDEYGGDFNNDDANTVASPGGWFGVIISPSSKDALLDNVIIRYAGKYFIPTPSEQRTNLFVDSTDVVIKNSVIEYSLVNGVTLNSASADFENTIVRFNNLDIHSAGIIVIGGSSVIKNNTIHKNSTGIKVIRAPDAKMLGNNLTENTSNAITVIGDMPYFSENSGSENGVGGIVLSSDTSFAPETTTLAKNVLPYVLDGSIAIKNGSSITFEQGTVIKGKTDLLGRMYIENGGEIFFDGSSPDDVIFTSFYDDTIAGDSDNSTTTVSQAGDWGGIIVLPGGIFDIKGVTIRYAGGRRAGGGDADKAALFIKGGSASISDVRFDSNFQNGIRVTDGGMLIAADSTLQNHTEKNHSRGAALSVDSSEANLENIIFLNNTLDIYGNGPYTISCTECGLPITEPDPL